MPELPEDIQPNDPGHITHHDALHSLMDRLDNQTGPPYDFVAAGYKTGTLAARPAADATNESFYYFAYDTNQLFISYGNAWVEVGAGGGEFFNVQRDGGAVGDGAANDTAAVQAAIDAASADGLTLLFPAGTYRVGSLMIPSGTLGLTMLGESYRSDLDFSLVSGGGTCLELEGASATRAIALRSLSLTGNSSSGIGMDIALNTEILLDRCRLRSHGGPAVNMDGTSGGSFRQVFRDCLFDTNEEEALKAYLTNSVLIESCYFHANNQSGGIGQVVLDQCRGMTFVNDTFDGANAPVAGIVLGSPTGGVCLGTEILGGYFENQVTAIKAGTDGADYVQGLDIRGLEIVGAPASTSSIELGQAAGVTIGGCFFTNFEAVGFTHIKTSAATVDMHVQPCEISGPGQLMDTAVLGTRVLVQDANGINMWTGGAKVPFATVEALHQVGGVGEPVFTPPWTNLLGGFAVAGFLKDPEGFVHIQGVVQLGLAGVPVFTLPVGYRPAQSEIRSVPNSGAYGELQILANGQVIPTIGTSPATYVDISCVFQAA